MLQNILNHYHLNSEGSLIEEFGSGLINDTWKVTLGDESYILQRINTGVFKKPGDIDHNLRALKSYLTLHYPDYLFAGPIATTDNETTVLVEGDSYRLQPFIKGSHSVDAVETPVQAYEAAKQFGKFSRLLGGFDPQALRYTLPDFHNLQLRMEQFTAVLESANVELLALAETEITFIKKHLHIADLFISILKDRTIPLRVVHHDTKISNVLFNEKDQGICVIDLDTVMPGYFISDVGDMMRTYLCAATEEEQDIGKIRIRMEVFKEINRGYMEEMGDSLTKSEKALFIYSGKFMIFMQAIRFLTDYLNNDSYYPIKYAGHNLVRARNQITLLEQYLASEPEFKKITG